MQRLLELFHANCLNPKVDLSNQGIRDLAPLMDTLLKFPNLKFLDLQGNKIPVLPSAISSLPKLQILNISNNMFDNVADLIPSLQSIQNLRELVYRSDNVGDMVELIKSLPKLEMLNGVDVRSSTGTAVKGRKGRKSRKKDDDDIQVSLTEAEMDELAAMYGRIERLLPLNEEQAKQMDDVFDSHMKEVLVDLEDKLSIENPFSRQSLILLTKFKLFEVCFDALVKVAYQLTPKKEFGDLLQIMRQTHASFFHTYTSLINKFEPTYSDQIKSKDLEIVRSEKEIEQLMIAAEALEKDATKHSEEKIVLSQQFEKEKQALISQNKTLRREFQVVFQRCKELEARLSLSGQKDSEAIVPSTSSPVRKKVPIVRSLTLQQLKEHITAIYESKAKFDKKSSDAQLPRETMEQHMYTYLNQKYGLKHLIVDHASAIIKSINVYADKDNDVEVFGKIIRNEIDEEFRFVQQQIKNTVSDLLKMFLKEKYGRKTDAQIQSIFNKRVAGELNEDEWKELIKYMYDHDDAISLIEKVLLFIREQPQTGENETEGKILYNDLLKILLEFQLRQHELYIAPFLQKFSKADEDHTGVLNEGQFISLARSIDSSFTKTEIETMINKADPNKRGLVTFSDIVTLLSKELVAPLSKL